jgi:hypothetical protein
MLVVPEQPVLVCEDQPPRCHEAEEREVDRSGIVQCNLLGNLLMEVWSWAVAKSAVSLQFGPERGTYT